MPDSSIIVHGMDPLHWPNRIYRLAGVQLKVSLPLDILSDRA